jgi:hypothetical protein
LIVTALGWLENAVYEMPLDEDEMPLDNENSDDEDEEEDDDDDDDFVTTGLDDDDDEEADDEEEGEDDQTHDGEEADHAAEERPALEAGAWLAR